MNEVGMRHFLLEEWMTWSRWNQIIPTKRIDEYIKLELDSSN